MHFINTQERAWSSLELFWMEGEGIREWELVLGGNEAKSGPVVFPFLFQLWTGSTFSLLKIVLDLSPGTDSSRPQGKRGTAASLPFACLSCGSAEHACPSYQGRGPCIFVGNIREGNILQYGARQCIENESWESTLRLLCTVPNIYGLQYEGFAILRAYCGKMQCQHNRKQVIRHF